MKKTNRQTTKLLSLVMAILAVLCIISVPVKAHDYNHSFIITETRHLPDCLWGRLQGQRISHHHCVTRPLFPCVWISSDPLPAQK